jgi:hypothetical protein
MVKFSEEEVAALCQRWAPGWSLSCIAKEISATSGRFRSAREVAEEAARLGLPKQKAPLTFRDQRPTPFSDDEVRLLLKGWAEGLSHLEIVRDILALSGVKRTRQSISLEAERLGLTRYQKRRRRRESQDSDDLAWLKDQGWRRPESLTDRNVR